MAPGKIQEFHGRHPHHRHRSGHQPLAREKRRVSTAYSLGPELRALAEVYAQMVYHARVRWRGKRPPDDAYAAWMAWYDTTPDTPCIAICSTSQGDALCKGCGRSFDEVQRWTEMGPVEKRATWRRISLEATAWRFNRYAERAAEAPRLITSR
jgi:predicted Fe-S protein YdhL (DUF1289 family)